MLFETSMFSTEICVYEMQILDSGALKIALHHCEGVIQLVL